MPLNLELTISGLCVLVLRSDGNPRPTSLSSVDVLCVAPHQGHDHDHMDQPMHRPRLSYLPEDLVAADDNVVADLVIDQTGRRIASLDLAGKTLGLNLGENPHKDISVSWGPVNRTSPAAEAEEAWLNWVPTVQDLGFAGLQLGGPGQLVAGAGAVLSLPNGILSARNIVRMVQPPDIIEWEFPAAGGIRRAIANDVIFRANGVEDAIVLVDGQEALTYAKAGGLLQISISNDLAVVGPEFPQGSESLDHLRHIEALVPGRPQFHAPRVPPEQRTGHPICNQALFIV